MYSSETAKVRKTSVMRKPSGEVVRRRRKHSTSMAYLNLNQNDLMQLKEVFQYFDTKETGLVTAKQLGTTLRCLQPCPPEVDVEDMMASVNETSDGVLTFQMFLDKVCEVIQILKKREKNKKQRSSCYQNLSEANIQELKEAFAMFDQNGDGNISIEEMAVVMKSLGHEATDDEIRQMVDDVDTTESGSINFEEFMTLMTRKKSTTDATAELKEAFDFFDKDGDGSISADELQIIMAKFGEDLSNDEIEEMMKEADTDGDGTVDYQEFVKMMSFFT